MRKLLIPAAVAFLAAVTAPQAQTVGFADAIKILGQSCGKDIETYCKTANLANNEIGKCLDQNQSKVSQQCNADRATVMSLLQARFEAQAVVEKICDRDARQYCKGVKKGSGRILRCLLKAQRSVGNKCNAAIDLAGYR